MNVLKNTLQNIVECFFMVNFAKTVQNEDHI